MNGDTKRTNERVIPWLVRWASSACSALAALVDPVQNIFFLTVHYFDSFFPKLGRQPCWVACLLVCVSGGEQKKGRGKKKVRREGQKNILSFKHMNGQEEDKGKGKAGKT